MLSSLLGKRVVVTGGAGFLGSFVVEALRRRGVELIFVVPRTRDYDVVTRDACRQLLADAKPDVVFHLAARVGGIGANRDNPGLFLFENAMMGLQLLEECRLARVAKAIIAGTICAYPKFCPVPFKEDDLWNGYPEETNAPYGIAKKLLLVQSQAYRQQYGMNSIMLFPVNLHGPRDNFEPKSSYVDLDPRYLRPTEGDHLLGDPSKAMKNLGWKPKVRFKELIQMMVRADDEDVRASLAGRAPRQ